MAGDCDVCIVHNVEASAWRDYIVRLVTRFVASKGAAPLRVSSVDDSSLTKTGRALPRSSIIVVVLSPAHLDFLRRQQSVNYRTLVDTRATNALVLRCGVAYFDDLASHDAPVFSQFFGWTKINDVDNGEPLTRAVARLLSSRPTAAAAAQGQLRLPVPDNLPRNRSASSLQGLASCSGADSPLVRPSSGDWVSTALPVETSDDALTSRHFRVIPTTIRCEVRSLRV